MIRVVIERQQSTNHIDSFSIKGHANFAEHGHDIVCAGVSAITVGTVNSAEAILGIVMQSQMKDGFLQASVPEALNEAQQAKLQLLLESMIVMLKTIEKTYGSYIQVQEKAKKRR
jgi:uncharacterized protein YsxB (DUF464 family)